MREGLSDVDQKSSMKELKPGPMARARMKKLKASNGKEDNGMIAYVEEVLKNKFEEIEIQRKTSKMFSISSINKNYSKEQLGVENYLSVEEISNVSYVRGIEDKGRNMEKEHVNSSKDLPISLSLDDVDPLLIISSPSSLFQTLNTQVSIRSFKLFIQLKPRESTPSKNTINELSWIIVQRGTVSNTRAVRASKKVIYGKELTNIIDHQKNIRSTQGKN
ncbi:hypothetical protein M9H77_26825 [Catharanthus roseus]|uniref:Uncharacterized protein n=1 Tax=Catharanthus roseus TaxID=4058 RepID=A0ACC0AAT2_CATRO|nr:hypothetical protein M9H77_26825 [Catharanthus roseus]